MFMMVQKALRRAGAALGIFVVLAGCGRQIVNAAGQPYEIVTQVRPESREAYLQMFRRAYSVCAITRAALKLPPPPPLVELPADFVIKRSTFLSSGSGYLIRHEEFHVDIADMAPETGCKSRLGSTLDETVVHGKEVNSQRRELDGHMEVDEPTQLEPSAFNGSSYTEKRTVAGITMRCAPAALRTDITLDMCGADTGAGVLLDGLGRPILLHAREFVPVRDMVLLTKPVSVQVGKPVSKGRIQLSGTK